MENVDFYNLVSMRRSRMSLWNNYSNAGVFRRSRHEEEDDEEALKYAALEKLPMNIRMKKGILTGEGGEVKEVDVTNIHPEERKILLERLLKVAEADNEKFLLKLKERIDSVGINIPTIEVRFEHLKVDSEAYVGRRALPTIYNFSKNMMRRFMDRFHILPQRKRPFSILDDLSGIIKPGRMTLLLGPPGAGKTTLLLALAGKLDSNLKVSGRVTYNGHRMNEFVPQRSSAYISQHDVHIGEMTVRETLDFSARCQGGGAGYDMLAELSRREKAANITPDPNIDVFMKAAANKGQEPSVVTDYILKITGLDACADTLVGNDMFRGISGGQRKQVTTGHLETASL